MAARFALVSTMLGFLWASNNELWSRDSRLLAKEGNQVGARVLAKFFFLRKANA
jgi:hypothetical protein